MWFAHDHDMEEHPAFVQIKVASGLHPLMIRGALSAWFELVHKHAEFMNDGSNRGIVRGYSLIDLVDLIGIDQRFWELVVSENLIVPTEEGLTIPDYQKQFPKLFARQTRGITLVKPKRPRGRPCKGSQGSRSGKGSVTQ